MYLHFSEREKEEKKRKPYLQASRWADIKAKKDENDAREQAVKLAEYELKLAQERVAASDYGAREKNVPESGLGQICQISIQFVKQLKYFCQFWQIEIFTI